jgi:hypothetical protein
MAKYLLLKHYRGAPAAVNNVSMDQWTPAEIEAHMQYMQDCADRLKDSGEFVDSQALKAEGAWVRYDGEGKPPVTDDPFAETKDLIAGFMAIDVESYERAVELSVAPGAGGKPIHQWLEVGRSWELRRPSPSSGCRSGGRGPAAGPGPRRLGGSRPLGEPSPGPSTSADDTLQLYFRCAHPSLSPASAVALTSGSAGPDAPGIQRGIPRRCRPHR